MLINQDKRANTVDTDEDLLCLQIPAIVVFGTLWVNPYHEKYGFCINYVN